MFKKLAYCPYGNAHARVYPKTIVLFSYTTPVIYLTKDENGFTWLECTGTYSRTTIKHISAFLKEYAPSVSYYTAKYAFEHRQLLCIDTGEIVEY